MKSFNSASTSILYCIFKTVIKFSSNASFNFSSKVCGVITDSSFVYPYSLNNGAGVSFGLAVIIGADALGFAFFLANALACCFSACSFLTFLSGCSPFLLASAASNGDICFGGSGGSSVGGSGCEKATIGETVTDEALKLSVVSDALLFQRFIAFSRNFLLLLTFLSIDSM